jgi:hypothetical protein
MLIRKLPKKPKRETRFRSQRHLTHVRSHACVVCDAEAPIDAAHVRLGSGAGMGQKPHDYLAVALCKDCHQRQHEQGERTFWGYWEQYHGKGVQAIIAEFIRTSPVRREIEAHRQGEGK